MIEDHPRTRRVSSYRALGAVGLLLLAFLVRAVSLEAQGLWRDEVDQWRFAFQSLSELLQNFTRPGWNGPLYSPLLRGWIAIAGDSVYAMRLLSVFWGVLTVALVYVLGRRLMNRRAASLAALLMALSPYMVWYAQEIKMYTWVPMLVLLALYAFDWACEQPRAVWWVTAFLATSLAIYSHILAALLVPVLFLWFWLHPRRHRRAWIGAAVMAGGLTLPYLPLLQWQAALALVPRETGFPTYTLGDMVQALANGWSAGIYQGEWGASGVLLPIVIVFGALAGVGVVTLLVSGRWRAVSQLIAWLTLPLLVIWLVSLRGPIFTDRYLIWSAPAFYLLIASGLSSLVRRLGQGAFLFLLPLLVVDVHGLYAQAAHPIKPQFDEAARLIDAERDEGDLLLFQIPYNHHVFGFYTTRGLGAWGEAPYTNWRQPDGSYQVGPSEIGRMMRGVVAGYDRIWLIYSEVAMWDERELVKGWLDETYRLLKQHHFAGVSVYLYERPPRS
ncbi:MAG: glycosyltransferase family 39 protein [Anaerolineae bacterium]